MNVICGNAKQLSSFETSSQVSTTWQKWWLFSSYQMQICFFFPSCILYCRSTRAHLLQITRQIAAKSKVKHFSTDEETYGWDSSPVCIHWPEHVGNEAFEPWPRTSFSSNQKKKCTQQRNTCDIKLNQKSSLVASLGLLCSRPCFSQRRPAGLRIASFQISLVWGNVRSRTFLGWSHLTPWWALPALYILRGAETLVLFSLPARRGKGELERSSDHSAE